MEELRVQKKKPKEIVTRVKEQRTKSKTGGTQRANKEGKQTETEITECKCKTVALIYGS